MFDLIHNCGNYGQFTKNLGPHLRCALKYSKQINTYLSPNTYFVENRRGGGGGSGRGVRLTTVGNATVFVLDLNWLMKENNSSRVFFD